MYGLLYNTTFCFAPQFGVVPAVHPVVLLEQRAPLPDFMTHNQSLRYTLDNPKVGVHIICSPSADMRAIRRVRSSRLEDIIEMAKSGSGRRQDRCDVCNNFWLADEDEGGRLSGRSGRSASRGIQEQAPHKRAADKTGVLRLLARRRSACQRKERTDHRPATTHLGRVDWQVGSAGCAEVVHGAPCAHPQATGTCVVQGAAYISSSPA